MLVAALIVKNESKWLPECLESLYGVADAIVVCDTGSTDNTHDVIDTSRVHLVSHEWCDDFSAARNAALDAASDIGADWIMSIDADERVAVSDPAALKALLAKELCDVFEVPIYNMEGSANSPIRPSSHAWVPRIFRNPGMRWHGRLHEQLLREDDVQASVARIPQNIISLDHLGYCREFEDAKRMRNLSLAARMLSEEDSSRSRFEMARALALAGETEDARRMHQNVADDAESGVFLRMSSLFWLALAAHESREHALSLSHAEAVLALNHSSKLAQFFKGLALFHLGLYAESDSALDNLSDVSEGYIVIGDATVYAMSARAKLRAGGDPRAPLTASLSVDPFGQPSHVALLECLSVDPLACAAALAPLEKRVTLTYLTSLAAEDADALAEAVWEYGQSRLLSLAWFSKKWEILPPDRAVVWATRAAMDGLNVVDILDTILSKPGISESLHEVGSQVLDSFKGGLS